MNPKDIPDDMPCEEIPGEAEDPAYRLPGKRNRDILEALFFVAQQPLTLDKIQLVLEGYTRKELQEILKDLIEEYHRRDGALEILEVASGYQVRTKPEFSRWIRKLKEQKPVRLSRPSMETLAIIAYRQPITRAEIESIRGVDSMGVLGSLVEKQLIRILGRKEVPGRPLLYGTTQVFLEVFGLKDLKSMPTLKEIEEMVGEEALKQEGGEEEGGESRIVEDIQPADSEADNGLAGHEGAGPETPGTEVEEEGDLAGEVITTEEMDEILKSARAKYQSARKIVGVKDDDEGGPDENAPGDTGQTQE